MPVSRTLKKGSATAATALLLVTGPLSLAPAVAAAQPAAQSTQANSVPPPVDRSLLDSPAEPEPDATYTKNSKGCIASNTGNRSVLSKPHAQIVLRLEDAHRFATGKGVKIAIIDTGVEVHPRLEGRVEAGGDYVVDEKGTTDCDGHGTEVAGVAAASKDDSTGFVGAAPEAQILAIRQTSDRYESKDPADPRKTAGKVTTLAKAIVRAVDKGADVINISLTSCDTPKTPSTGERKLQAAIDWAVNQKNVVIVTAAGNLGTDGTGCPVQNDNQNTDTVKVIASPPWYGDDVLSVASIDVRGEPSQFSVWGPWISLAAPGEDIITLDPKGQGLTNANADERGALTTIQGTSFAAPYVSGIAALVRQRFPDLTARQVMDRLTMTAQHPGNHDGRDHKVGAGMINPVAALTAELPSERAGAVAPEVKPISTDLGPGIQKDTTQLVVALSGTGIGVGLLLLTLFVVHTVQRNRDRSVVRRT
ncbi:type VII secretion-associated serine protease mycosin [Umezawaea endophytica]|uniref:Type VII secretion-associated serine protease mycosin n=1 Tax=Umezawaea endophytica TaxID=1654476 RepID=A0A9X2VQN6_9PSEU|nr:type VII secretion-associated serine protease mycosin [Umezawaea endophytica]MCS7480412.1 type VII secretion-associated serine protease mycosin [Umezawaea endophytica]